MKTSELIGPALDWAVSYALGHNPMKDFHSHGMTWRGWWETTPYIDTKPNEYRRVPRYSIDWSEGGPIIEREELHWGFGGSKDGVRNVIASKRGLMQKPMLGPTPLIAAMRCLVASKLGDEIEIPEELK